GVMVVAGGLFHSLAVRPDGMVWAWGRNADGQLGNGTLDNRVAPEQVQGMSGGVGVAGGYVHSLAVRADGTFWAWGSNADGQVGDGTTVQRLTPVQVQL
ncbi:MAG TPA: RCC1 repeat-containing protein, partial [Archangium sp.]|nr:RCC1 repeat-containing protein [Archangium sp.]